MAKRTVLRKRDKDKLNEFISVHVKSPKHHAARDAAAFKLTECVSTMVRQIYPQEDMLVLDRYSCAQHMDAIRVVSDAPLWGEDSWGVTVPMCYTNDAGATLDPILVPSRVTIKVMPEHTLVYEAACHWKHIYNLCQQTDNELRRAFRVLVESTTTLEELAVAWPEALQILSKAVTKDPDLLEAESLVQQNLCERGVLSEGCK